MKSSQLIKQGRFEEAMEEINSMLQPVNILAVNIEDDMSLNAPVSPFSHTSKPNQQHSEAYYLRGQISERQGSYHEAILDY